MMRKFEFKKSYEEIEIAGEIYKLPLDDESIRKMYIAFENFGEEALKLDKVDVNSLNREEQEHYSEKQKKLLEKVINSILNDDKAFDVLYVKSGKSLYNMTELLDFIGDLVGEKYRSLKNREKEVTVQKYKPRKKKGKK